MLSKSGSTVFSLCPAKDMAHVQYLKREIIGKAELLRNDRSIGGFAPNPSFKDKVSPNDRRGFLIRKSTAYG